jgi:ABC-type amino acid transport substrate-binding protein
MYDARSMLTGRRALAVVALLGALLLVAGCHRRELGGTLAKIQARGEITWGADLQGGEPYLWLDDGGRLVGFEVDVMDAVARRLGVKARMTHYNWVNLVPLLSAATSTWCATASRPPRPRRQHPLSRPYFVYAETLAVRSGGRTSRWPTSRARRSRRSTDLRAGWLKQAGVGIALYEDNQAIATTSRWAGRRGAARQRHRRSLRLRSGRHHLPARDVARGTPSSASARRTPSSRPRSTRRWRR